MCYLQGSNYKKSKGKIQTRKDSIGKGAKEEDVGSWERREKGVRCHEGGGEKKKKKRNKSN